MLIIWGAHRCHKTTPNAAKFTVAGSTGILKYFRPVGSSSSSTTPTLPDPNGPLSERVPAKAIEMANAEVKQSKESSHG